MTMFNAWILVLITLGAQDTVSRMETYPTMQDCFLGWDELYFPMTKGGKEIPVGWQLVCIPVMEG